MLSQLFLEWWFDPWRYAAVRNRSMLDAEDYFGRRDAYRLWCLDAGVAQGLPPKFDAGWCVMACRTSATVLGAARLFGGLVAARDRNLDSLCFFRPAERKWCLSIAATQPLQSLSGLLVQSVGGAQLCGLLELSIYLERGFPGLWSRVRLALPDALAQEMGTHLDTCRADRSGNAQSDSRPQRCWRMCLARADAIG